MRPGLTAGALGPSIVSLNTNKPVLLSLLLLLILQVSLLLTAALSIKMTRSFSIGASFTACAIAASSALVLTKCPPHFCSHFSLRFPYHGHFLALLLGCCLPLHPLVFQ